MKLNIDLNCNNDEWNVLRCPVCNNEYIHHEDVEIFNRDEDSKIGQHTTITRHSASIDLNMTGNPSSRRSGLTISFTCEIAECNGVYVLELVQHKGHTLLRFRK